MHGFSGHTISHQFSVAVTPLTSVVLCQGWGNTHIFNWNRFGGRKVGVMTSSFSVSWNVGSLFISTLIFLHFRKDFFYCFLLLLLLVLLPLLCLSVFSSAHLDEQMFCFTGYWLPFLNIATVSRISFFDFQSVSLIFHIADFGVCWVHSVRIWRKRGHLFVFLLSFTVSFLSDLLLTSANSHLIFMNFSIESMLLIKYWKHEINILAFNIMESLHRSPWVPQPPFICPDQMDLSRSDICQMMGNPQWFSLASHLTDRIYLSSPTRE